MRWTEQKAKDGSPALHPVWMSCWVLTLTIRVRHLVARKGVIDSLTDTPLEANGRVQVTWSDSRMQRMAAGVRFAIHVKLKAEMAFSTYFLPPEVPIYVT